MKMGINRAFLGLGSNMGDREQYLHRAVEMLDDSQGIKVVHISSVYETDPVGYVEQKAFLNMVVEVETYLMPWQLLEQTARIETSLNRKREIHWGPRTLDIDILLYNEEMITSEKLIIPHPYMMERAFVLVPLVEIAPHVAIPMTGKGKDDLWGTPLSLLPSCPGQEGVRKLKSKVSVIK